MSKAIHVASSPLVGLKVNILCGRRQPQEILVTVSFSGEHKSPREISWLGRIKLGEIIWENEMGESSTVMADEVKLSPPQS